MRMFYKDVDTTEQSLAKAKQGSVHIRDAVRQVSAAFDLLTNSDRASADDQGSLARIYDELEAIQKRVEATAADATPATESHQ